MLPTEPVEWTGRVLIVLAAIILFLQMMKVLKSKVGDKRDILNRKQQFYNRMEEYIEQLWLLKRLKEKLQLKYGVINSSPESKNRTKAVKTMLCITIGSMIMSLVVIWMIKVWYVLIPVIMGIFVFPYILLFVIFNFKLYQLHRQFPNAINLFFTKYTSEKNKDIALKKTYMELQNPIRYEFMRLSTMMANKSLENVVMAVRSFCARVNYVWADVFGELLIMNHISVRDIGDELGELSVLMAQDQSIEAEKRAEINATKGINIIVAFFVFAAVFFNIVFFKQEAINIYFERYIGMVSIGIAIATVILCLALTFYFERD